ncbi:hypothetical protein HMPREF1076_05265 [Parabacteroides goldsteinii CL02T12C30]|jgi:hypothetical protein|uniref:Uncharacterized protein n=1 Tax=Parabacteroides goldsteinii CL02T12C30 TaxID=999418 RepID=K5XZX8_9BACT|nr:hypothetical protein HMPREF1076_05265 [Parabacteroides goldsteinii CL02T12C30]
MTFFVFFFLYLLYVVILNVLVNKRNEPYEVMK